MRLRHIHLPGITKYSHAIGLQSKIVDFMIEHHKAPTLTPLNNESSPLPNPTLITFQSYPTYTSGRRETGRLSPSQITYLKNNGQAEFHEAPRGGLTTFHGPGQLTAFLICSLKQYHLRPHEYVQRLETIIMDVCQHYRVTAFTTEHPGVWNTPDDKLASIGVLLRRGITSYGVGLNVSVDLSWFGRIVACGLVGKSATSLEKAGGRSGLGVDDVAPLFARFVALRLPAEDPQGKPPRMTVEPVFVDEISEQGDGEISSITLDENPKHSNNRENPPP